MKNSVLKIINPLLLLLLLFQLTTAVLRGSIYGFFHRWHPLGGYVLAALAVLHLVLNWKWVGAAYRSRP